MSVAEVLIVGKKIKVLIVDDDPQLCEVLMNGLDAREIYQVQTCPSAEDAALMMTEKPDIILLDALLPKMNGFEFCKKIRDSKIGKSIPIIIMTGIYKQHFQEKEARMKYGASDYLMKPFNLDKLDQVIQINLGTYERGEITQEGLGFKAEGSISSVPVEKLLKNIAETGKTGLVQVARGKTIRRLYFLRGRLVHALSNIRIDSLSQVLQDSGKITPEQREKIDLMSKEKRWSKEKVVLMLGLLNQQELIYHIEQMCRNIVFGLLSWKDGEYKVILRDQPPEGAMMVDLDMKKIIIQGILKFVRQ